MKKIILITLLLSFFSFFCFSQNLTKTIKETKINGFYKTEFIMVVNIEKQDTTHYVSCYFQNQKYSTITDLGSISIVKKEDLLELIKDLKTIIELMDSKPNFEITKKSYRLYLYDFAGKTLYVEHERKHTTLNKKNASLWLLWLESIDPSKLR